MQASKLLLDLRILSYDELDSKLLAVLKFEQESALRLLSVLEEDDGTDELS